MKRDQQDDTPLKENEPKHRKTTENKDDTPDASNLEEFNIANILGPHVEAFEKIQDELCKLDAECAREQMAIQKKYDETKKPLFESRQKIIDNIPGFWFRILRNHPALTEMVEHDHEIMQHLTAINLDDNLDENGSYKVTFTFDEAAKAYMDPLCIYKHVKFVEEKPDDQFDSERPPKEVIDVTKIKWKSGKSPVEAAVKLRRSDKTSMEYSIFEWFDEKPWDNHTDIGEIIRREIWHAPLNYLIDQNHSDDEDDELDASFDEDEEDERNANDYGDGNEEDEEEE